MKLDVKLGYYLHEKSDYLYSVVGVLTNATNAQSGDMMIVYKSLINGNLYTREVNEFYAKFTFVGITYDELKVAPHVYEQMERDIQPQPIEELVLSEDAIKSAYRLADYIEEKADMIASAWLLATTGEKLGMDEYVEEVWYNKDKNVIHFSVYDKPSCGCCGSEFVNGYDMPLKYLADPDLLYTLAEESKRLKAEAEVQKEIERQANIEAIRKKNIEKDIKLLKDLQEKYPHVKLDVDLYKD